MTNRLQDSMLATRGDDIESRHWFLIDFDPVRKKDTNSTDEEHSAAIERSWECRRFLAELGFPGPIHADSGNGAHLSYRIDLPNNDESRDLIKRCLGALASKFSDTRVKVDPVTFNAARVWKLYGTQARKGEPTADRPHRLSSIIEAPGAVECVPLELLKKLAAYAPLHGPSPKRTSRNGCAAAVRREGAYHGEAAIYVERVAGRYGLTLQSDGSYRGSCPIHGGESGTSFLIGVSRYGQVLPTCFGGRCSRADLFELFAKDGLKAPPQSNEQLCEIEHAARKASWAGRGRATQFAVLLAHIAIAKDCFQNPYGASERELKERAKISSGKTLRRANRGLVEGGWLYKTKASENATPNEWELRLPATDNVNGDCCVVGEADVAALALCPAGNSACPQALATSAPAPSPDSAYAPPVSSQDARRTAESSLDPASARRKHALATEPKEDETAPTLSLKKATKSGGATVPFPSMRHAEIFRYGKGLGPTAGRVFGVVLELGPITAADIAEILRLPKRSVNDQLKRLTKVDMVVEVGRVKGGRTGQIARLWWFGPKSEFEVAEERELMGRTQAQRVQHAREREVRSVHLKRLKGTARYADHNLAVIVDSATGEVLRDKDGSLPAMASVSEARSGYKAITPDERGADAMQRFLEKLGGRVTQDGKVRRIEPPELVKPVSVNSAKPTRS